jgi:16S rRNA (uracil1498-N3)-methyltransferase
VATAGDRRGAGPERAFAETLASDAGAEIVLSAEESHHLLRVRRVRRGDPVVLFDGRGTTRAGRVVAGDAKGAVVRLEGPAADREPARALTMAVSLPEGGRADALVGALAELGVARLVPLTCARTPKGRDLMAARRADRWLRLCREAAKVNGRCRLLEISGPKPLDRVLEGAEAAVMLDPDPRAPVLPALLDDSGPLPWLVVGPEGGFTEVEVERAAAAGARRARLGAVALRTATAAVAAAAVALATG